LRKSKTWLWITLIVVALGSFLWLRGMYGTARTVITTRPDPTPETKLFPSPEDTAYHMDLKIDPINLEVWGHSVIVSRNCSGSALEEVWLTTYPNALKDKATTPAPQSAYYSGFDPGWLTVSSVLVNQSDASWQDLGISCRIDLPEPIYNGESLTIEMDWKARIPQAAYRYGSKDGVILLGHFYPVLNVLDDSGWHTSANTQFGDPFYTQSADYTVRLWVPEAYQVAASGEILSIEAEDNGWQTMLVKADKARDFALAVMYNYQVSSLTVDGIKLSGFFNGSYPAVENQVMERAAAAVKYFSCTYGSYTRPQLILVQGPMKGFQGMEYSGLIFLAEEVFAPGYDEQRRAFLLAHEIAHQWWYDMVGNNQLEEPWLDEGLANWSARQYLKTVEYRSQQSQSELKEINLQQGLTDMDSKSSYLGTAYQGGENFWYQLEEELGEEKVLQVLRTYLATYRFQTATTEDLRWIISQQSTTPLESFFERWFTTR
jgi:hypothetical protein